MAIFNLLFYGIPLLFFHKNKPTLTDKFNAIESKSSSLEVYDLIIKKVGRKRFGFGLILLCILLLSGLAGDSEALKQKVFLVMKSDSTAIFLRSYGDYMIFTKINRCNMSPMNELLIIHSPSYGPIMLKEENIGPLNTNLLQISETEINVSSIIIKKDSSKIHSIDSTKTK
jgi:hypothetical protein